MIFNTNLGFGRLEMVSCIKHERGYCSAKNALLLGNVVEACSLGEMGCEIIEGIDWGFEEFEDVSAHLCVLFEVWMT